MIEFHYNNCNTSVQIILTIDNSLNGDKNLVMILREVKLNHLDFGIHSLAKHINDYEGKRTAYSDQVCIC